MNNPTKLAGSKYFSNNKKQHHQQVRLTITDVSRMHGDRVCIFGVDGELNYIRPVIPFTLIHEHHLYDNKGKRIIKPFALIEFDLIRSYPNPPHTEDYIMNPCSKPKLIRNLDDDEAEFFLESILDENVNEIFGTKILNNKSISKYSGNRSIGTVKVKKYIKTEHSYNKNKHKLRIQFLDSSGEKYNLPVTDCAFYKYYTNNLKYFSPYEIDNCLKPILNKSNLYFRVGLSRIDKKIKNHYLLITGIYSFPDYKK